MKHLDLFSGIGGFALACQWNGIETIGFVEIDKYCQKVLKKRWPDVPIVEDIRDVEKIKEIVANAERIYIEQQGQKGKPINVKRGTRMELVGRNSRRGDILLTESNNQSPALLITAGFPCQPFSVAGKRGSKEDDRYLWPETLAVIKAIKPAWILLENVTGIIPLALDTVLSDLEGAGYSYETLIIPACAVNAPHRRDRVWIVAHSKGRGIKARAEFNREAFENGGHNAIRCSQAMAHSKTGKSWQQAEPEGREDSGRGSKEDVADSSINRLEGEKPVCKIQQSSSSIRCSGEDWWAIEPQLGRVAHGIPHRVDRLKCLGNAIVPQVASEIIKTIVEIENELSGM